MPKAWTLHQNPENWASGDADGTSLGTSDGTVDPATTSLSFTGGDGTCNNGGGREASVTLSGAETPSLTATEPSTCVYALQLALPGCLDAFCADAGGATCGPCLTAGDWTGYDQSAATETSLDWDTFDVSLTDDIDADPTMMRMEGSLRASGPTYG